MKHSEKSYVIFGIGKFGQCVAEELSAAGVNVLAVDEDEERVSAVADVVTMAVMADVTDVKEMESLGLSSFDGAIVATTGDLAASVMGVIQAKEAGIPFVLAKASDEMQARVFERLGADRVVIPEQESAARIANVLLLGGLLDVVNLSERIRMAEIPVSDEWKGKTLRELELRKREQLNVVAVRWSGGVEVNWEPDQPLPEECSLIVVAERQVFDKLCY